MLKGVLVAVVLLAAGSGAALAHAALVVAEPADGAVLASAPESFRLQFSEAVSPTSLRLIAPDGKDRDLGQARAEGDAVVVPAPAGLAHGSYALIWRVISADGHPVGGTLLFAIGAPGGVIAPAPAPDWPLRGAIWITRVLLYLGLFVGVGGVFVSRWLGRGSTAGERVQRAALLTGLVAAALSLGLQGLDMLGQPLGRLLVPATWVEAAGSSFAWTVGLAVLALVCALLAREGLVGRVLSAAGLLLVGLALTASGHVSSAPPFWLTRPAIFLHVTMVAFWIGALIPLGTAFAARTPEGVALLQRFSRLIPWALLLLVVAGIVMARLQIGGPRGLATSYGRVFVVKLALLVLLLSVAAVNRFRLTARVARGEAAAIQRFRRAVAVELVLALAIFATVALWRFTPPPRALAVAAAAQSAAADPAILHLPIGDDTVMLHVDPGHTGPVAAEIYVYDEDGEPIPAEAVTLTLANPGAGIEPIRRKVTAPDDDDAWQAEGLSLPAPGTWQARIEVQVSASDQRIAEGTFTIPR